MTPEEREAKIGELLSDCSARQLAEMYVVAMESHRSNAKQVKARPLGERVLVKVLDEQQGTWRTPVVFNFPFAMSAPEGQQLEQPPPPEQPEPARGIVVSVGPGYVVHGPESRHYVELDVKVGDEVLFYDEKGLRVKIAGEELVLIAEQHLLIVLDSLDGDPARSGVSEDDAGA